MSQQNEPQRPATTNNNSPQYQPHSQPQQKQQFKLPKLAMPQSRGRLMSRKENKAPTYLPNIHDESDKNFRNTEIIHISKSQHDIVNNEENTPRDEFACEIEEKLKLVVTNQEQKNAEKHQPSANYQQEDELSDDMDFEQKILQNKEIIKMHRKKTQLPERKTSKPLEALQKINQFNRLKSIKPQSNYQKKMKDYNMSLENKYLQRKKQSLGIIPEKPQKPVQRAKSKKLLSLKDAAIDEAKLNFGYKQFKSNPIIQPNQLVKSQNKDTSKPIALMNINKSQKQTTSSGQHQKSAKQVIKTQEPTSPSKRINRTSALFDNIQSFLQNPIGSEKHQKLYKELYKKLKSKSIPQLEEQLKQLSEKLGGEEHNETKSTVGRKQSLRQILLTQNPIMQRTVRDWKRVDVKDKTNIHCEQSNFQKELDYINYLQEKNSTSLSKFIDQQKIMVELQINRRISKSIGKETHSSGEINKESKDHAELRQTNTAEQST